MTIFPESIGNQRVRQVAGLFSVNLVTVPIGIVTSIVITRYLGPQGYGDYSFLLSIFQFAMIIFTFGFFQAANRALVLTNDKQQAKEYYGAALLITGALFIVMSLCLVLYARFDSNIQEKKLSTVFLFLIPFGWVYLLLGYFETLFQADNRIRGLAMVRLFPKVGFLITAGLIYFVFQNMEINRLAVVFAGYLTTQIVVYLFVLLKVQVSFGNLTLRLTEIWQYNKAFGLNVYVGSLFALGFLQLTGILISYFGIDNSGVGFYSLALTFCMPLSLIPNTIATTHYKDFALSKRIPKKLFTITLGMSLAALVFVWMVAGPFVTFFYGTEFAPVIALNFVVSFGVVAHGMADFFNRFLGANGQGKALRNCSFLVGGSTLTLSLLLVPRWGEYGAAYARVISGVVYLFSVIWYYKRFVNYNEYLDNEA